MESCRSSESQAHRPAPNIRKRIMRFAAWQDVLLLREVVAQNPFIVGLKESGKAWSAIAEKLVDADESFAVDGRRCRERTLLMLEYYKQSDIASLKR